MKKSNEEACKIAHYIHDWLKEYTPILKSCSPNTVRSYTQTLSLFINFLEVEQKLGPSTLSFHCFSRTHIEQWVLWLGTDRSNSPETCNSRLASLRAFLKYLASRDIALLYLSQEASQIPRKKMIKKKIAGISKKAIQVLMTMPDVSTKTGRRDLALLIILYGTAARIDEILSLKLQDLHLDTDKPSATVIGKGSVIRTLYLLPKAVAHLNKYLKEFHLNQPNPESFVFYSRNKGVMSKMSQVSVNKQIKKHAASAHVIWDEVPLDLHAHQLRHSKATHWLQDGMNIVQISFLLGHASILTTMVYLDITTDQESNALMTLEEEDNRNISKKWKSNSGYLSAFCGLNQIVKK